MKILVTGGGGFLGSSICRQLAATGHAVTSFQRRPARHLEKFGILSLEGDIRDADAVLRAVADRDAVIHCAARAGLWGDAESYRAINVGGTANVIEACRARGVGHLVWTSSPSVVMHGQDIEGGDESLPLVTDPLTPYQASKVEGERMIRAANSRGLSTVALRPHMLWGPGDPHLLPRLADRAVNDRLFLPAPDKKVDLVFVENAARGHVQALRELASTARCAGRVYFITNNDPQQQGPFILRLLEIVGIKARIRRISPALARIAASLMEHGSHLLRIKREPLLTRFMAAQLCASHWFDGSAARRDIGYVAPISIEQGLAALARHHQSQIAHPS